MRVIQYLSLALLFSSLFQDWGGFGISFIARTFRLSNSIDLKEGGLVIGIFFCMIFFVFINEPSKKYKIFKIIVSLLCTLIVSYIAVLAYSLSNFMRYGDREREFDASALASISLMIL